MKIAISGPDDDRLFWIEIRAANGLASAWSARADDSINGKTLAACKVELAGSVETAAVYPRLEIDIIGSGTAGVAAEFSYHKRVADLVREAYAHLARTAPLALLGDLQKLISELDPAGPGDPPDTEASPLPTSTPRATPGYTD